MPVLATGQLASGGLESSGMIPDEPGNLFYRPCILAEVLDHHRFQLFFGAVWHCRPARASLSPDKVIFHKGPRVPSCPISGGPA